MTRRWRSCSNGPGSYLRSGRTRGDRARTPARSKATTPARRTRAGGVANEIPARSQHGAPDVGRHTPVGVPELFSIGKGAPWSPMYDAGIGAGQEPAQLPPLAGEKQASSAAPSTETGTSTRPATGAAIGETLDVVTVPVVTSWWG